MPWLSIIMAVLAFFVSGGAKKENRGKAALIAAGVGAGTYYVTHETDWGQENLGQFDGVETTVDADGNATASTGPTKEPTKIPTTGTTADSGAGGFWNTLGGWLKSPSGQLTTGAAGAAALGVPKWLLWGGVALGAYLLLKD